MCYNSSTNKLTQNGTSDS